MQQWQASISKSGFDKAYVDCRLNIYRCVSTEARIPTKQPLYMCYSYIQILTSAKLYKYIE